MSIPQMSRADLALPLCLALIAAGIQAAESPSLDQIRGATIAGIFEVPVTLADGVYEGEPTVPGDADRQRLVLVGEPLAVDDFEGADGDVAAALLSESSGGSGERIWLAVVGLRNARAESLGTALVGDRVRIRSLAADGADLVLTVIEAGPNEPACCPTQAARKTYRLRGGSLALTNESVTGSLSLAMVAGGEWTLLELDGTPLAGQLKALILEVKDGRIAGFDGCNRFMGKVEELEPGRIVVGPLAGTRMACPGPAMELERRFLAALNKATRYDFLAGRLLLSGEDGALSGTLLFGPNESGPGHR